MLATLGLVAAGDLILGSAWTGQIRLWFPVWVDPHWASDSASPVTYSQSYIAGIALLLPLLRAVEREVSWPRSIQRALYWCSGVAVFGFIVWWKGGLMLEHGKEREAILWLVLGGLGFATLDRLPLFPRAIVEVERRVFLRRLALGLVVFFWAMALLDPLIQVGVHGLSWSPGLIIEVGFFIPAGAVLLLLARRLGRP